MKMPLMAGLTLLLLAPAFAEKPAMSYEKFYGKITQINPDGRSLTVHNKKNKVDATFRWDDQTGVTFRKKKLPPADLKVGQSLIISYVMEGDLYKARKITVRPPTNRQP